MKREDSNFIVCIKKIDLLMNRIHSTSQILQTRTLIKNSINSEDEEIPDVMNEFILLLTTYCVSDTEVNTVKQIIEILNNIDQLIPVKLVEGENILISQNFLAHPELVDMGCKVGDKVWYIDEVIYLYEPLDLIEGKNVLEDGHFIGKNKDLLTDYSSGDTIWYIDGIVYDHDPYRITDITITNTKNEFEVGDKFNLEYTYEPSTALTDDVKYLSETPNIVKINETSGEGECLGVGDFSLSIKSEKYGISRPFNGNVKEKYVPVTSAKILNKVETMNKGQVHTLEVEILPENATDKTYRINSNNQNLFVSDNDVTAVIGGSGEITLYAADGKIDSMSVEILVPTTGIDFNMAINEFEVGDNTTLYATTIPSDATNQEIEFTSSDSTIALLIGSSVEFLKEGEVTLTAKQGDITKEHLINVISKT